LETAGWYAVAVQQVGGIAFASRPFGVASVKLAIRADGAPNDDAARIESGAELLDRIGF
jgi:hypothetical protein